MYIYTYYIHPYIYVEIHTYMYVYIYIYIYIDGNTNYLLFWPVLPQRNLTSSFVHSLYLH